MIVLLPLAVVSARNYIKDVKKGNRVTPGLHHYIHEDGGGGALPYTL
jgi:hypothetical protein